MYQWKKIHQFATNEFGVEVRIAKIKGAIIINNILVSDGVSYTYRAVPPCCIQIFARHDGEQAYLPMTRIVLSKGFCRKE
jgi:hypothetical protein